MIHNMYNPAKVTSKTSMNGTLNNRPLKIRPQPKVIYSAVWDTLFRCIIVYIPFPPIKYLDDLVAYQSKL